MASREIRDLTPELQVLYNKFFDRCRRDVVLLKDKISVLLTCTHREPRGKNAINRVPSEAFEIIVLQDGRPIMTGDNVVKHAEAVGLKYTESGQYEKRES